MIYSWSTAFRPGISLEVFVFKYKLPNYRYIIKSQKNRFDIRVILCNNKLFFGGYFDWSGFFLNSCFQDEVEKSTVRKVGLFISIGAFELI